MRWNLNNEKTNPVQALSDYIALKLHFQGDIVWRPDLKMRISSETLAKRKDAWRFKALAKEYPDREDCVQFLVSAFMWNPSFYLVEAENDEFKDFHKARMRRMSAIYHNFSLEMEALTEYVEDNEIRLSDLLNPRKKPAIMLVSRNIVGGISIETLAILEHFFGYCREAKTADPLWNEQAFKISRYKYFCQPDKSEMEKFDRHVLTLINCSKKD